MRFRVSTSKFRVLRFITISKCESQNSLTLRPIGDWKSEMSLRAAPTSARVMQFGRHRKLKASVLEVRILSASTNLKKSFCACSPIGRGGWLKTSFVMSSNLSTRTNSVEVWCNASIRVLGTRGDSSTLSSPTKHIANCRFAIADWPFTSNQLGNQQSKIGNAFAPVAQVEECDASNVEVAGSSPARSSNS